VRQGNRAAKSPDLARRLLVFVILNIGDYRFKNFGSLRQEKELCWDPAIPNQLDEMDRAMYVSANLGLTYE
jgi:hypothetical protein